MAEPAPSLEEALARTEADADGALSAINTASKELRKAKSAAAAGSLRDLARAVRAADGAAAAARESAARLVDGWSFDERAYFESGAYAEELQRVAAERGLTLVEQDGRLLTYPSVIRVVPGDAAVEVNRKRERRVRPAVLVERLRAAQQNPPRLRAEQFLETLYRAYELVRARDRRAEAATVKLLDVYGVLTPMPGQARDYSKPEFARDIYLLDRSGVVETRDGLRLTLPAATGTRGPATLSTVTPEGQLKVYYGIAFNR